jgi:hypothetical protein
MKNICNLFRWDNASEVPKKWSINYGNILHNAFMEVITKNDDDILLLDAYSMLAKDDKEAFLRSPQVASQVLKEKSRKNNEWNSGQISSFLLAALARNNVISELPFPVWTALGDQYLEPQKPEHWNKAPDSFLGELDVVLDVESFTDFSCEATGNLVHLDKVEICSATSKLNSAVNLISRTSANALSFWAQCVDVVALRKTECKSSKLSSSSFFRNARLSLISNSHLECVDTELMADALIHEAIHSLLFMYEEIDMPFVNPTSELKDALIVSPWTGNSISLPSYVHACVVWYGLYWFWNTETSCGIPERRNYLKNRAKAGFFHKPFSTGLHSYTSILSPAILELLTEIELTMDF